MQEFIERPDLYLSQSIKDRPLPTRVVISQVPKRGQDIVCKGHCVVELSKNRLKKAQPHLLIEYKGSVFGFASTHNMLLFMLNPALYELAKLPEKLPVVTDDKNLMKKVAKKGDPMAFLEHHVANILMKVLAQLGENVFML